MCYSYYFPLIHVEEPTSNPSSLGSTSGVDNRAPEESNSKIDTFPENTSSNENNLTAEASKLDGEQNIVADKKKSNQKSHVPDENILVHLLEMCRVFDLSDEMGR